jgi:hypothetical protein
MKNTQVARLLAYVTGTVNQQILPCSYAESHSRKVNPNLPTGSRPRTVPASCQETDEEGV